MTTATGRGNIVIAKYLYVATMSFIAGCLNVASISFTMRSSLIPLTQRSGGASFEVPAESLPLLVAGAALLALFAAAGMMILAAFARTFREGQALVSPFLMVFLLPIAFVQGPAQEFTTGMAFIPVINVALMFRQVIGGYFDWPLIGITLLVEMICVLGALKLATAILKHEDFAIGAYNGSFLNFVRHRLLRTSPAAARGSSAR
jgi:sodium transport system permease protein